MSTLKPSHADGAVVMPQHSRAKNPSLRVRISIGLLFAAAMLSNASLAFSQQVVDQILALVNDEAITRTDLLWSIAMDPKAPSPVGPVGSDLLRQKLDVMIDERLTQQEAARIPASEIVGVASASKFEMNTCRIPERKR